MRATIGHVCVVRQLARYHEPVPQDSDIDGAAARTEVLADTSPAGAGYNGHGIGLECHISAQAASSNHGVPPLATSIQRLLVAGGVRRQAT